jgi:hypothetical protein
MTKASPVRVAARLAAAGAAVAILVAAWAPSAQAASKKKVGVSLNGMPAGPVREAISDVLKHHGFETATPELSGDSEDAIASAARQSRLAAVIVGEVRDGGKRVKLRVYGASGDLIGEGSWMEKGGPKKLGASVERTLWARIGGSLSKAHPDEGGKAGKADKAEKDEKTDRNEEAHGARTPAPAAEETPTYSRSKDSDSGRDSEAEPPRKSKKRKHAPVETDDAEVVEAEGGGASTPAGNALDLAVGPRFMTRSLGWTNTQLRGYTLGLAPSVGAQLAWYPAAHVMGGWKSNLGIAGSFEYTPGLVSQTSDGFKYPTKESDFWGGARGRLVLGPVEAAATVGYGQHVFIFLSQLGGANPSNRSTLSDLPDVKYSYLRAGADVRVALPAKLALMLGGAYRYVLSAGDVNFLLGSNTFLPRSTVMGFDVSAAVGYRFLPVLEGRVGFDLRRYMVNAHYQMPDLITTTGGTDQFLAFWAHLALVLEGSGHRASVASGDDEDEGESPPRKKRPSSPPRDEEPSSGSGDDE